jgi:hypothetical protein
MIIPNPQVCHGSIVGNSLTRNGKSSRDFLMFNAAERAYNLHVTTSRREKRNNTIATKVKK